MEESDGFATSVCVSAPGGTVRQLQCLIGKGVSSPPTVEAFGETTSTAFEEASAGFRMICDQLASLLRDVVTGDPVTMRIPCIIACNVQHNLQGYRKAAACQLVLKVDPLPIVGVIPHM